MQTQNERPSPDDPQVSRSELVARAADEFLSGDNPGGMRSIESVAAKYPAIAEIIRDSFPHLAAIKSENGWPSANDALSDIHEAFWRELLSVGKIDEYRVVRYLGSGAMGVVFEGTRERDQIAVALKFLVPYSALTHKASSRFEKEVRAMECVRHPHVVGLLATGKYRGIPYCVLELVRGKTLAQLIAYWAKDGHDEPECDPDDDIEKTYFHSNLVNPPSWQEIARIGFQAALGIHHAHRQGVIHRDLKPANVMLDGTGQVKVTDFGLAFVEGESSLTTADVLLGTIRYMSPEQVRGGDRVDARSDVYSLAVTLYELSALHPPFPTADRVRLLHQVSHEEPAPIRKFRPDIPRDFEMIVQKGMAKRPQDRYATALGLAEDLRRFINGEAVLARKPSYADRLARVIMRHPRGSTATLVAIISILALLTLGYVWARDARNREAQLRIQAESTKSLNDRLLYAADVRIAASSLHNKNMLTAAKRLARHIPKANKLDRRNFAWHYVWNEVHSEYVSLDSGEELMDVAWSLNGESVAVAGITGKIAIWDTRTRRNIHEYQAHQESVHDLEYSRDGRWLASGGDDGTITLWDVANRRVQATFKAEDEYGQVVCFSADGETLFSAGARTVFVWRAPWVTPVAALKTHPGTIYDLAVSKSGLELAVASGNQDGFSPGVITFRDIASNLSPNDEGFGKVVAELINESKCTAVEWLKQDKLLAVGDQLGGLTIWERGRLDSPRKTFHKHASNIVGLSCSRDERWLATASKDSTVRVWDTSTWDVFKTLQSHTGRVHAAEFSSVADEIVSTGSDSKLKFWYPEHATYRERQISAESHYRVTQDPSTGAIFLNSTSLHGKIYSAPQNRLSEIPQFPAQQCLWIRPNLLWISSGSERLLRDPKARFEDIDVRRPMSFDLDADGDLDWIACFGVSGELIFQENVGNTEFKPPRIYGPDAVRNVRSVVLDVDGDGISDRFGYGPHQRLVWVRGATNKMQTILELSRQQTRGNSLGLADLNSDGILDPILLDAQSGSIDFLPSRQDGDNVEWKQKSQWNPGRTGQRFLTTLDIDDDGKQEIVLAGDHFVSCYSGPHKASGETDADSIQAVVSPTLIQAWELDANLGEIEAADARDVDGDGRRDLILASLRGIWYHATNPRGEFDQTPKLLKTVVDANWLTPISCNVAKVDMEQQSTSARFYVPCGVSNWAWSPARKSLVSIGRDQILRFWDAMGKHTGSLRLPDANIPCLAFSPDGEVLAIANGDDILIIDPETRTIEKTCRGHQTTIHALGFSHKCHQLVTVSGDLTARIWDVATGESLHVMAGHTAAPISVAYSQDDEIIASGDSQGCVRLWDAQSGDELLELTDFKYRALSVAFENPMKLVVVGNSLSEEGVPNESYLGEWEVAR
jgi:WD40 repeat protein/serine/threonine protein kinase